MIGFLWSCKQGHHCAAAKRSEVCIALQVLFQRDRQKCLIQPCCRGEQDHGVFLAQSRSGSAPPCRLTTSVMSDVITTVDLVSKLLSLQKSLLFSCTYTFLFILHSRQVHGLHRAFTYTLLVRARFYIHMRTVNMPLDSRAFQLRRFTSFQSLSCSFSKNGKALQPELGKKKRYMLWQRWQTFGIALCD